MGGVGLRWVVLFDSHNHLQSDRFTRTAGKTPGEMVAEMREAGVGGCVVNGTWEGDWDEVAALAEEFEGFVFPAYGIHPWRAATVREGWEGRLRQRLEADPRATVGEPAPRRADAARGGAPPAVGDRGRDVPGRAGARGRGLARAARGARAAHGPAGGAHRAASCAPGVAM